VTVPWVDQARSPLGTLTIVAADHALCALDFPVARSRMLARIRSRFPRATLKRRRDPNGYAIRVHAYFSGDCGALDGIAVDCRGTSFEEQVWNALRAIPAGTTTTSRALAEVVRHPRAVRAVGLANALEHEGAPSPSARTHRRSRTRRLTSKSSRRSCLPSI
jgi:methylated-DNA-[protein]-cysteine S-methyltransferase